MSKLVYQGDTIDNFGKYLPTPYIEKVAIGGEGTCTADVSIFIKLDDDEKIDDVLQRISNQINIYLLFVVNKEKVIQSGTTSIDAGHDHEYNVGANGNGWTEVAVDPVVAGIRHKHSVVAGAVQKSQSTCYPNCKDEYDVRGVGPHTHTLKFNESIERVLSTKLNIFEYYRSVSQTNNDSVHSFAFLNTITADFEFTEDHIAEDFYDENGDRIIKFSAEITLAESSTLESEIPLPGGEPFTPFEWSTANDLTILSFSSTFSYNDAAAALDDELKNEALFNKQISDIAYEKIFENGVLVSQLQAEFFDSTGTIYNGTPLRSVNGVYYKAANITHDTIVDYFNNLLSGVVAERYGKLQEMKDKVAYTLSVYGDSADLVYRLNLLRKVFSDKSGATPVGRFYFRFKKRIFATNKNIQTNQQLAIKVIRNPKFVDERSVPEYDLAETSWRDSYSHQNYLYNQGYMGRTALYSSPSRTNQQSESREYGSGTDIDVTANTLTEMAWEGGSFDAIVRNAGYFFFDYEKALRYVANINQIVDVEKLISYGIPVDYEKFRISEAQIKRTYGTGFDQYVEINSHFASSVSYPQTITTETNQSTTGLSYNLVIPSPGFYSDYTPEGEEASLVLTQEEHTSLMIRNFKPIQVSEISSKIPNYRLICFEFQDFMDDDLAVGSDVDFYDTKVVIEDKSIQVLEEFIDKYSNSQQQLGDYIAAAEKDFSYDESTGLFNEFFVEGMEAKYSGNEANAPWYRAPVLYNLHRDLLFNIFGGDLSAIFEDSQNIMNNINPFNGSYYALIEFYENMNKFFEDNYSSTYGVGLQIAELSDTAEKVFKSTLVYNSAGNTDEPYGVVYTAGGSTSGGGGDPDPGTPFPLVPMLGDEPPTYGGRETADDDDTTVTDGREGY